MEEQLHLYFLAAVPVLGVLAQWLAWRTRLPSILLLLAFGILLGYLFRPFAGGRELIPTELLFPVVSLSVGVILFEGGLSLRIRELRDSGRIVLRLVTVGAVVTWLLTAAVAWWIFEFDVRLAALIGAILIVTGPTVVAPLLRHIRPTRRIASVVKWEGIVIDPIGAVLAVLVFEVVLSSGMDAAARTTLLVIVKTIVCGGVIGAAAAGLLVHMVKRYWIPDFLHSPVFLASSLASLMLSNFLQPESGLVAVTVLGVVLANQKAAPVKHIIEFKENLQVLLIASLFVVLGSRIDLDSMFALGLEGVVFIALLVLTVRPLSVLLATWGTGLRFRERIFLSFLAPRGIVAAAVASIFSLQLSHQAGVSGVLADQAEQLVPLTFLVILATVAIYGLLAAPLARVLQLSEANPQGILFAGAEPLVRRIAKVLQDAGLQVMLVDTNYSHVAAAGMEGLSAHCASILAEYVHEENDLSGIGRMLAMTANDEVNALASREFAHLVGRRNVYQLPPSDVGSGRRESVAARLRGRTLFAADLDHAELLRRVDRGAQIKKTQLTEEFTFDDFRRRYGGETVVLFVIDAGNKLEIATADEPLVPKAGQTVVALVNTVAQEEPGVASPTEQSGLELGPPPGDC